MAIGHWPVTLPTVALIPRPEPTESLQRTLAGPAPAKRKPGASLLTVPRAKHGQVRHVKLNSRALAALISLTTENSKGRIHEFISPRSWFEPVVEKSGVESFTWHALRHTFVSRLVMNGVDLRTVQELAGHKSIAMTMRYAHLARATSTLLAR